MASAAEVAFLEKQVHEMRQQLIRKEAELASSTPLSWNLHDMLTLFPYRADEKAFWATRSSWRRKLKMLAAPTCRVLVRTSHPRTQAMDQIEATNEDIELLTATVHVSHPSFCLLVGHQSPL